MPVDLTTAGAENLAKGIYRSLPRPEIDRRIREVLDLLAAQGSNQGQSMMILAMALVSVAVSVPEFEASAVLARHMVDVWVRTYSEARKRQH